MGRDAVSERTVEPWGLFFLGGHWYLAARDPARGEGREGLRNFRVDRVRKVAKPAAKSAAAYDVPADFRLAEHAASRQAWALGDDEAEEVVIAVVGRSGAVLPALRVGEPVDGGTDGPPRRRLRVRRRDAFLRWASGFAGEVVPVSPPAVVEAWREHLRATRARYEHAGATRREVGTSTTAETTEAAR
jgi:predicted DNA-binding transcriptional regulator YafY